MMTRMRDLKIHAGLAIVTIDGFESDEDSDLVDMPGSANWLCDQYGMSTDDDDGFAAPGIIWTDYDGPGWQFSALIDSDEADELVTFAREAGYAVISANPIDNPTHFGDGSGIVEILKHRDGWVILA